MVKDFAPTQEETQVEQLINEGTIPSAPRYTWPSDAQFSISGGELEFILSTLNNYLSSEKAKEVLTMVQLHTIAERMVRKGIEDGTISDASKA